MRTIILILTIFFVGCNQKSNDIEDVEIMTYFIVILIQIQTLFFVKYIILLSKKMVMQNPLIIDTLIIRTSLLNIK